MMGMIKFIFNEAQKNSFYLQEGFKRDGENKEQEIDEDALSVKMFDYQDCLLTSDRQLLGIL